MSWQLSNLGRILAAVGAVLAAAGAASAFSQEPSPGQPVESDLCVYGGTSAGVAAAVEMQRLGRRAVLVAPGKHLGGMSSSGLSATDWGNKGAIGGVAREFYRRVQNHYARTFGPASAQARDAAEGFRFEPHIAEKVFCDLATEAGVPVFYEQRLREVRMEGARIREIVTENGSVYRARMFIDATYEGDLMARARVSYTVGRESNATYGETLNGIQFARPYNNFRRAVDPYVIEKDPSSGLLPGVSAEPPGSPGDGDRNVQAYNFRVCLTNVAANRLPMSLPVGYDARRYTLLARYLRGGGRETIELVRNLPNGKTATNSFGAFSTDYIGGSRDWPEGDYATRDRVFQDHVAYQQGLLWFLGHDESVPEKIRTQVNEWGLPKDEFLDNGGWPYELYVREARRMVSDYVMTEHNCRGRAKVDDSVGLAAYAIDSHHVRRIVRNGIVLNEGDVQVGGFPPYPISYRSIVPKERECWNLLVPVCVSASHVAFGSIRMEPVFMILGQSAGAAAYTALTEGTSVQGLDFRRLQSLLRQQGQVLDWNPKTGTPSQDNSTEQGDTSVTVDEPRPGSPGSAKAVVPETPPVELKGLKGIVMDDAEAQRTGDWQVSPGRAGERRFGTGYLHDNNAAKGAMTLSYTPDIPEDGSYAITLIFPPGDDRASNVPITLTVGGLGSITVRINEQSTDGDGAVSLGVYRLPAGRRTRVTLSNKDTDGLVVADAIQFVPVGR